MRFILFIIFSLCLPLVMQGQEQNVWTQNDSLKLKKILAGQAEIRINREALRELDRAFSSPRRLFKSQSRSAILLIKDFLLYRPNVYPLAELSQRILDSANGLVVFVVNVL